VTVGVRFFAAIFMVEAPNFRLETQSSEPE